MSGELIVEIKRCVDNERKLHYRSSKGHCLMNFYEPVNEIIAFGFQCMEEYEIYSNLMLYGYVDDSYLKELIKRGFKLKLIKTEDRCNLIISKYKCPTRFSEKFVISSKLISNNLKLAEKWAATILKEQNIELVDNEVNNVGECLEQEIHSTLPFSDFV